jgi:hypothetical protein
VPRLENTACPLGSLLRWLPFVRFFDGDLWTPDSVFSAEGAARGGAQLLCRAHVTVIPRGE